MKTIKKLMAALLLATVAHTTFAQNTPTVQPSLTFTDLKSMPSSLLWPAIATDGKYIYIINAQQASGSSNGIILKYDTEADTWEKVEKHGYYSIQSTAVYEPSNKQVYFFGGVGRSNITSPWIKSIDIQTGAETQLSTLNRFAVAYSKAAEWNGKIYIWGGAENGHSVASLNAFDPKRNEFSTLAPMPAALSTDGTIVNGVLYTFGGYNQFFDERYKAINAYNIATNTWATVGNLPTSISANCVAAVDNLIFVVGDDQKSNFLGYYNTVTAQFTQIKSNMKARRGSAAIIVNNKLYVFGSNTTFSYSIGAGSRSVQVADISGILKAANTSTASTH